MQPPEYLEKLQARINRAIEQHRNLPYEYILVGSGTVHRINQEIVKKVDPANRKQKFNALLLDWQTGNQTLCGLKGIPKEAVLYYEFQDIDEIIKQVKLEIFYGVKFVAVPGVCVEAVKSRIKNMRVLGLEKCLFFD